MEDDGHVGVVTAITKNVLRKDYVCGMWSLQRGVSNTVCVCVCVLSGCVDEHFAKSLGSAWTRIKSSLDDSVSRDWSTSRPVTSQPPTDVTDDSPGSVDEHFAKALGDTWFRIKAEHEALVADADNS